MKKRHVVAVKYTCDCGNSFIDLIKSGRKKMFFLAEYPHCIYDTHAMWREFIWNDDK